MDRPVEVIHEQKWLVNRTGWVEEVHESGGKIKYHAQVKDENREAFIGRWFNDPTPAADFIDKVRSGYDPREEKMRR
jgi:hypothetical protein